MDYKTHWWRIDIFINTNNPYLIFTLFPRMKLSSSKVDIIWFIQNSELDDHLWKSQRNQATSNPIYSLIHSNPPFYHHSTSLPFIQLDAITPCFQYNRRNPNKQPITFIQYSSFHSTMQTSICFIESKISVSLGSYISMDNS